MLAYYLYRILGTTSIPEDDLPQKVHPTVWTVSLILAASQKLPAEDKTWQALKTFQPERIPVQKGWCSN